MPKFASLFLCAIAGMALSIVNASTDEAETPTAVSDSPQVALVANEIRYDVESGVVRAIGQVEVFYKGNVLTAAEIIFHDREDRVEATGGVTLRRPGGEDTLYADTAELDRDLQEGLIRGARLALAQGAALIAAETAERSEGRYNILNNAVYSPCEVCIDKPVPLWRIRAARVVHDEEGAQIHYRDAYFDVMGVPIGYLPYFRHPSPEVKRADGFLPMEVSRSRAYGLGVKAPYFMTLGDHADLTLTPFVSSSDGGLLETEYRRRFESGYLNVQPVFGVTNYGGDGRGAQVRFGGTGEGRYYFDDKVNVGFDLNVTLDDAFPRRYNYTEDDRLTSELFVRRYNGSSFATASTVYLQSLRAGELQENIPYATPEIDVRQVIDDPLGMADEFGLSFNTVSLTREAGRDVSRFSFGVDASSQAITDDGLVLRVFGDARLDHFYVRNDAVFDDATRIAPRAGVEARFPLMRVDEDKTHLFEPIVMLVAAPRDVNNGDIPNEDSQTVEFETSNLFEVDRFAGFDQFESGVHAAFGARYALTTADLSVRAAAGRLARFEDTNDFTSGSGLDGILSDYVMSFDLDYMDHTEFRSDWRVGSGFGINRAEFGVRTELSPFQVSGSFLWVEEDPAAGSPDDRSELLFAASTQLSQFWQVSGDTRYDPIDDRFVTAGGALTYQDECAGMDFFVRRQFAESDDAPRSTTVGLRFRLFGTGAGGRSETTGACAYGVK
ncbi:MAG: LPS-assembly protein LptD [Pikeienuella sp.]